MALIGYARVSTHEQNLHLQQDALTAAGCLKIFTDTISGVKGPPGRVERSRPVFRSALYSPFAPAFRSRECHNIRPCTVQSLPLTEACLRNYRTSLFIQAFTKSG
jgi:hypothetical protein